MKTVANNQYDKPFQQVVPIDFQISKIKKYTNDKAIRLTGIKFFDRQNKERIKMGLTKYPDEMIDTVSREERAVGFWTRESKKGLIREIGLVVLKQE